VSRPDYHPIGDYALIADGHTVALVARDGSIDWCCLPRLDAGSAFGRLLDARRGGHFAISPADERAESARDYEEDTVVLVTAFGAGGAEARLIDCLVPRDGERTDERRRLLRIVEGVRGEMDFVLRFEPRFDYGSIAAWVRRHGAEGWSACGGDDALLLWSECPVEETGHALEGRLRVRPGERVRVALDFIRPEQLEADPPSAPSPDDLDADLEHTRAWWREWAKRLDCAGPGAGAVRRSAITLKALSYLPTGAIAAAATTSLPECLGASRNWDYRFSWIRDSSFAARSFSELGCTEEADAFRRFIERSAAGHAEDVQILYGIGGERRIGEQELDHLAGYRDSAPVHAGNGATGQLQLDALGELVNLSWRWHQRGHSPDDDHWRFLLSLVDMAAERWRDPDHGLWEWRGDPEHFVHSKVWCWAALDRGIRLADECLRRAPTRRWARERDAAREAIESEGYDSERGVFVQTFGRRDLDAALLLLPTVEFVDWNDERMVRTADAVRDELAAGEGLLYRYTREDGLDGQEGAFVACSFWLAECLAQQGRVEEARAVFDRTVAAGNDVGLFSEECGAESGEMLGNHPQALSHLAHMAAWEALQDASAAASA
jgi:GH15 family glucan-1,4-alpha-glucosidase